MKNKLLFCENRLHEFINKYLFHIGVILILTCSFIIRYHMAPITVLSGDYNMCLLPWVEYYKEKGIIQGLSETLGTYYVPYNLFLAIVAFLPGEPWIYIGYSSILCDYLSSWFIYLIAKEILGKDKRNHAIIAALVSLFLPVSIFNSALWKQCDSVYTLFIIISIWFSFRKKYNMSFLMLGIGFIIKMQAIYLLPAFVILYIFREKGLSIFYTLWIPAMYLIGGLPAVFAGRRVLDVYDCYYHQANSPGFNGMEIGMPNLYALGLTDYPALSMPAILVTLCVFIFMAIELQKYKKNLNNSNILYICIWSLWTCIMFLPAQHERYNYPVIILLTIYYLVTNIRKCWPAIVINLISCSQYGNYLFGAEKINYHFMAIAHIAAFIYVTYDMVHAVKNQESMP